jgi:8-oxo-dGTP diphosphatase
VNAAPPREYPLRPVAGVGAVVIVLPEDRGRISFAGGMPDGPGVLLVKRRFPPLEGRWSLPGGALELGETLEAAIAREVVEETGLDVAIGSIVEVFDRILRDAEGRVQYHFVLVDFVCRPLGGRLAAGSDVADVAIADPHHLDEYDLDDKAAAVIRAALER